MKARLTPPQSARLLALGLLAFLLLACGGGTSAPAPTATLRATPIPPVATPTPSLALVTPTEQAQVEPEPRCPDPYPDGAPDVPEPGDPIRLRPVGAPPALARHQPLPFVTDPTLEEVVRQSIGEDEEHFAVVVKSLADGRGVALDGGREFYAASLFKTWVMLEAYHQREAGLLDFGERYIVSDHYGEFRLNPGELEVCDPVTVAEALGRMLGATDNVAANLLLDRVGAGNVNAALRSLGLASSGLPEDGTLPTTAADMALLLEAIARRQAVNVAASEAMLSLLVMEAIGDRLPALLPEGTQVAHKTGNWETATHDAGIVFSPGATYVIVVLTDFGFQDDGATPIARLSRAVYDYYNQD